jgi:hypothetical protein
MLLPEKTYRQDKQHNVLYYVEMDTRNQAKPLLRFHHQENVSFNELILYAPPIEITLHCTHPPTHHNISWTNI